MKKILSIVMGIGLVLSLGMAYAEEGTGGATYPSEKMIRDDDLQHLDLDQDRSTVNQMPALHDIEGSAPGGVREEPKNGDTDIEQNKEPVGVVPAAPGEEGTGTGKGEEGKMPTVPGNEGSAPGSVREAPKNTDTDIDRGKEPVDKLPAAPGEEGKAPERSRY